LGTISPGKKASPLPVSSAGLEMLDFVRTIFIVLAMHASLRARFVAGAATSLACALLMAGPDVASACTAIRRDGNSL
jgi:hypothetical protein